MSKPLLLAFCLGLLEACVIGRSSRPSQAESARGVSAVPVTGGPIVPQGVPEDDEAPPTTDKPGFVWVRGYWHWDGVRYVWQRGRWQATPPVSGS